MLAEIGIVLSSIKTAFDTVKAVQDILKGSKETAAQYELQMNLVEIAKALANAEMQIAEIQNAILEKDQTIREQAEALEMKQKMTYEAPFYWIEEDGERDGPFCQQCWDKDQKTIRLQKLPDNWWTCKTCRNSYES